MLDNQIDQIINNFSNDDWNCIGAYYNNTLENSRPFYVRHGGVRKPNGEIDMPYYVENGIVSNLRRFLIIKELNIKFDWHCWHDGKAILHSNSSHRFEQIDVKTVIKLFIAVLNNDRFNEGAFARLFESGSAELLLKRWIELKPL
jgi:hypothetical protein